MSLISPREIFLEALSAKAVNILLVHNHPSGSCMPSSADMALTNHLKMLLDSLEIRLYDHLIIGGESEYSFVRDELITPPPSSLFIEASAPSMAADKPARPSRKTLR